MPPWNSPNSAEITYSGTSPSNGRNSTSATPCSADPHSSVRTPPMRSHTRPETMRLTMPQASISDSISAPRAAPKPRSVQYATMCTCGIAIATQHATPATHSSSCACPGRRPNGRLRSTRTAAAEPTCGNTSSGGRWRMRSASSSMPAPHTSPIST